MLLFLEKDSLQLDPSVLSEKLAWQKEKVALQAALRKAEDDLVKATARNENRPIADLSNNKVNSSACFLFLMPRLLLSPCDCHHVVHQQSSVVTPPLPPSENVPNGFIISIYKIHILLVY